MRRRRIGIDVGGTGIKGAVVDLGAGGQHPKEYRPTPTPATPEAVAPAVAQMVEPWECRGRVGIALPFTVEDGIARTAGNISSEWIGTNAEELFQAALGRKVVVLNDTDAAGIAEARYGAADHPGTVLVLTFGHGDRQCGPAWRQAGAEHRARPAVRGRAGRGRVRVAVRPADRAASVAGVDRPGQPVPPGRRGAGPLRPHRDRRSGLTHEAVHWEGQLVTRAPLRAARFFNRAGVVGAAMAAELGIHEVFRRPELQWA
jgi:polyphosphate glucokinase